VPALKPHEVSPRSLLSVTVEPRLFGGELSKPPVRERDVVGSTHEADDKIAVGTLTFEAGKINEQCLCRLQGVPVTAV
jgi:hypothetical protein